MIINILAAIYGYARVSTRGQAREGNSLEYQENKLNVEGVSTIYIDTYTGTTTDRPELDKLLNVITEGDTLVVCKLDRIARSVVQGAELIERLNEMGVRVHILNMGVIDNSPTGKLIRNVMLSFAEFERDMIIQRTQEGKAIAKLSPDFREGRPKKYTRKQMDHALKLLENYSFTQVSEMTGISKSTLTRAVRNRKK